MIASEYETDLRHCVGRTNAAERVVISRTAALTKRLADLDSEIRRDGCDDELASLHLELLNALTTSLHRLGPDRICLSAAVGVLASGFGTAQAIFRILPTVGCA